MKLAALLACLVAVTNAASLRGQVDSQGDARKLQLTNTILNALINEFTPTLGNWLQRKLIAFDPFTLGKQQVIDLGPTPPSHPCRSSATITYGVGELYGFSDIVINRIELLKGSPGIDVSFLGMDGATWGGDWLFDVQFGNVTAASTVSLDAVFCGIPLQQSFHGFTSIASPSIKTRVTMEGETANIIHFQKTSQVQNIEIQEASLDLGPVETNFGLDGTVSELQLPGTVEDNLASQFVDDIAPFLVGVINNLLEERAPFVIGQ